MFKKISISLVAAVFIFGVGRLSFAMSCGGMDSEQEGYQKMPQSGGGRQHETLTVKESVSREVAAVDNKICPVSGEEISEETKATYEYEGKVYNFCCQMCIEDFKKEPQKYIKKVEEELQPDSKKETEEKSEMQITQEPELSHQDHQAHGGHQH